MRILMLHNRYQYPGGEEEASAADAALLRDHGQEVELLERDNREVNALGNTGTALRSVWARDSYRQVRDKLEAERFDVLHVQNFFPLWSPSVYYAAARAGVPVVQTLHNYRLMCVNSLFYRDHRVCEDCLGKALAWPGIVHACYRDSRAASLAVATMAGVHRLIHTWNRKVGMYIAVSDFAREKFIAGGLAANKIAVRPNCIHPRPQRGTGGGGYALYAGRLSAEKGVGTLLSAWQSAQQPMPLKIAGAGPLQEQVRAAPSKAAIELLGQKTHPEILELMRNAELLVFPSECYETMGRTILEALAAGTPVLASALGERASVVVHRQNGFLFPAGDAAALRARVEWCSRNLEQVRSMRKAARAAFELNFSADKSAELLLDIYKRAGKPSPANAGSARTS